MITVRSASFFAALLLTTIAFGFLTVAFADTTPTSAATSLTQADEAKARAHFVVGETALKSGDVLTAVVELEAALKLKPTSAYSAKLLSTASAKLGTDGSEAYAHYVNTVDLQNQDKLDEAEKELSLALNYHPTGLTPQCLTAKALELAALQKAAKPVDTAQPKPAATTTTTTSTPTNATTTAKPTASTIKKANSTSKSATTKSKPKAPKVSVPKAPRRPPVYRAPRPYRPPVHRVRSKLARVPGHYISGKYIPGHYTIKQSRPVALPPPP